MENTLNSKIGLLYDRVMKLDGVKVTYQQGLIPKEITVSLEDIAELAEVYYALLKSVKEVAAFTVKTAEIGLLPEKGDTFLLNGTRYIVFQTAGKKYFEYTDTSLQALRIAGYRDE